MTHWRKLVSNSAWLKAYDLDGKEVTLHVSHCERAKFEKTREQAEKSTIAVHFSPGRKGEIKPLGLNATMGATLETLTGKKDFEAWRDFAITLYPTTTSAAGGKEVECIRIRPYAPKGPPINQPQKGAIVSIPSEPAADQIPASASDTNGDI